MSSHCVIWKTDWLTGGGKLVMLILQLWERTISWNRTGCQKSCGVFSSTPVIKQTSGSQARSCLPSSGWFAALVCIQPLVSGKVEHWVKLEGTNGSQAYLDLQVRKLQPDVCGQLCEFSSALLSHPEPWNESIGWWLRLSKKGYEYLFPIF